MKLAFFKAAKGDFSDKLIAWWTHGKYSHVGWVTEDYSKQYSSYPKFGVQVYSHVKNLDIWDYIDIPSIKEQDVLKFFNLTQNDKYDWLGILGFILPLQDRTHKWFCSEWCSTILKINGYEKMWILEPNKISPNKLYKIVNSGFHQETILHPKN